MPTDQQTTNERTVPAELTDPAALAAAAASLKRCAEAGRAEAFRSEHLRDACEMICVEVDALRDGLAGSGPAKREAALQHFIETGTGILRIAGETTERRLAAAECGSRRGEAVGERADRYRERLGTWTPDDWLREYERAITNDEPESAAALDTVIGEMIEAAGRAARRRRRYAAAGLQCPQEGARPLPPSFARRFEQLSRQRAGDTESRRLRGEDRRFSRLIKRRLGL